MTPRRDRDLRAGRAALHASDGGLVVRLPYRPPFDWPAIIRFLEPRATPGVEVVAESSYRRTIEVGGAPGVIEVRPSADEPQLLMRVQLPSREGSIQIVERARRIFDLGADPLQITSHLRRSPQLRRLVDARPGLRVPGAWDGFELAVRAVLGQQVTVRGATTLTGRLVQAFGTPVEGLGDGLSHLFPRPEALTSGDLSSIGIPRARAATIRSLAASVCAGAPVLDASQGLADAVSRLCAIPGVGAWTAHYIAMRAFGEPDAFPSSDLGLRRALAGARRPISARALSGIAEAWRPWRAYAAMYLWTGGASRPESEEEGHVSKEEGHMRLEMAEVATPIGNVTLAVRDHRLCALNFTDRWPRLRARLERRFGPLEFRRVKDPAGVVSRLEDYFGGALDALASIEVDAGGTPFQRAVWAELRKIPAGRTVSYSDLARAIGSPTAVRAVGATNGANPIGIVIPCHRVIGADGRLVGYAGGVDRKRWLLAHEGMCSSGVAASLVSPTPPIAATGRCRR